MSTITTRHILTKKKFLINLIAVVIALLLLTAVVIPVYAWIVSDHHISIGDMTGSSVAGYFARGDGTVKNPYVIRRPIHLYNLAWLQYKGYFSSDTCFEFDATVDNKTIDMSGYAIPPIGTVSHPFLGQLNGNGVRIMNVMVSSIYSELTRTLLVNESQFNVGSNVGFFGTFGDTKSGTFSASAGNFYLENIIISTGTNNSTVGLVAGYANSQLDYIGVSNCRIKVASGTSAKSEYSLIGEIGDEITWDNMPGADRGGALVIDCRSFTESNTSVGGEVIEDAAFYTGTLVSTTSGAAKIYAAADKGTSINSSDNRRAIGTTSESYAKSSLERMTMRWFRDEQSGNPSIWTGIKKCIRVDVKAFEKEGNGYVHSGGLVEVKKADGTTMQLPASGIWFKPIASGRFAMVFGYNWDWSLIWIRNFQASLFKFTRNADGTVNNASIEETVFSFNMNAVGLDGAAYFEHYITKSDIDQGYEFMISQSTNIASNTGTSALMFLYLPGISTTGGGESQIQGVDYVLSGSFVNLQDNYENHYLMLSIAAATAATQETLVYYNVNEADNMVYYSITPNTGLTIEDIPDTVDGAWMDYGAEGFETMYPPITVMGRPY